MRAMTPTTAYGLWAKATDRALPMHRYRRPRWVPDRSAGIQELLHRRDITLRVQEQRVWMKATIQRLKHNGFTDAACRELVAKHLPRGKGPRDALGFARLDERQVKAERKLYMEKVNLNARRVQKIVWDLGSQRRQLKGAVNDLWNVTEKPQMQKEEEEKRTRIAEGAMKGL